MPSWHLHVTAGEMEPWYSMFMGLVSTAGLPVQALLESSAGLAG